MDGHRANGPRRSRRTRSQRDKQREAAGRAGRPGLTIGGGGLQALGRPGGLVAGLMAGGVGRHHRAPSSGSERENAENRPGSSRPRPPRRRRRDSVSSQDEDIIDGFAIASFTTLQALENDMQLKPLERAERLKERLVRRQHKGEGGNCRHGNSGGSDRERGRGRHKQPLKRKRETNAPTRCVRPRAEDSGGGGGGNGGGEVNGTGRSSSQERSRDSSQHSTSDRGYICDSDSDVEDKEESARSCTVERSSLHEKHHQRRRARAAGPASACQRHSRDFRSCRGPCCFCAAHCRHSSPPPLSSCK